MKLTNVRSTVVKIARIALVAGLASWAGATPTAAYFDDACYCWERDRAGYDPVFDTCVYCDVVNADVCGCGSDCDLDWNSPFQNTCVQPVN
jgi:hypothetical protein